MRSLALSIAAVVLFAAVPFEAANAQAGGGYPSKPVRMIVPFPPGGGFDGIARPFSEKLAAILGQPVVIDNRAGAAGNIGTEAAVRAAADGYTLLVANTYLATNPAMYASLPYDPLRDLVAITTIGTVNIGLAINPAVPAKNLQELIALSRKKPLTYGTSGVGTNTHLLGEMLNLEGTMRLVHVPYKGSGPAVADVLGGHVDIVMTGMPTLVRHIRANKLRGIAVFSRSRAAVMPDLPTFVESGIPSIQDDNWYGLFAPAGTPAAVITRLHEAAASALAQADLVEHLRKAGYEPAASTPQALAETLRSDIQKWARVVAAAKIPKE